WSTAAYFSSDGETAALPVSLAAAAGVALAAPIVSRFFIHRAPGPGGVREVATSIGPRATIALGDGSRVVLGPRSRLSMPEHFGDGPRDVTLDGEAYFTVQHDAAHPFRVHAAGGDIEDVGTRFVVRAYAGEATVRVIVADGQVSARRAGS